MEQEQLRGHFRDWWWDQFDHCADGAEFDAGSAEYAGGLLPILRNLTWPDFQVEAEGAILKLKRLEAERSGDLQHYLGGPAREERT